MKLIIAIIIIIVIRCLFTNVTALFYTLFTRKWSNDISLLVFYKSTHIVYIIINIIIIIINISIIKLHQYHYYIVKVLSQSK